MKKHNLLQNMVVMLTAVAMFGLFSFALGQGDLSTPLPSSENAAKSQESDVGLELSDPLQVSPVIEAETPAETAALQELDDEAAEGLEESAQETFPEKTGEQSEQR